MEEKGLVEALPAEVWLKVFEFLLPSDWSALSLVDKYFNQLASDNALWGSLIPFEWKSEIAAYLESQAKTEHSDASLSYWANWFNSIKEILPQQAQQLQQAQQHTLLKKLLKDGGRHPSWKRLYFNWFVNEAEKSLVQHRLRSKHGPIHLTEDKDEEGSLPIPEWVSDRPFLGQRKRADLVIVTGESDYGNFLFMQRQHGATQYNTTYATRWDTQ